MTRQQPDRPPTPDADQVGNLALLIGKVGVAVNRRVAAGLDSIGLRPKHLGALAALRASPSSSQQLLGEQLGVDASAVVAIVDDLEEAGLVQRTRPPGDRRRYALDITDAGLQMLTRGEAVATLVNEQMLAALTDDERSRLLTLLLQIVRADPDLAHLVDSGILSRPGR